MTLNLSEQDFLLVTEKTQNSEIYFYFVNKLMTELYSVSLDYLLIFGDVRMMSTTPSFDNSCPCHHIDIDTFSVV